jgi:hypothetical protein
MKAILLPQKKSNFLQSLAAITTAIPSIVPLPKASVPTPAARIDSVEAP